MLRNGGALQAKASAERPAYWLAMVCFVLASLLSASASASKDDPLPSWNEGTVKQAIMDFVETITDKNSDSYVEPTDRIATFDNDGTLWNEKPLYIHFFAIFDYMKEQVANDPTLSSREPYKSVATRDKSYFASLYESLAYETVVGELMAVPFGGMTTEAFDRWNREWLANWKHPKYKVGYEGLVYQPMRELLHFL